METPFPELLSKVGFVSVPCKASLATFPAFSSTHQLLESLIKSSSSGKEPAKRNLIRTGRKTNQRFNQMEIKLENEATRNVSNENAPLLVKSTTRSIPEVQKNFIQKAISQTFESTAHLANLLPTGSVLAFQLLAPIFAEQGQCDTVGKYLTAGLVALCGLSCFLFSFTDSIKDETGNICYGFATFQGLWIIDGSTTLPPEVAAEYKLKFIDFIHAFMSILVFTAITLFDQDVVNCFYPAPSDETQELLTALPVGIGVISSMLFVVFPTKRYGIGFPLTSS